jgi:hypothetical protein
MPSLLFPFLFADGRPSFYIWTISRPSHSTLVLCTCSAMLCHYFCQSTTLSRNQRNKVKEKQQKGEVLGPALASSLTGDNPMVILSINALSARLVHALIFSVEYS